MPYEHIEKGDSKRIIKQAIDMANNEGIPEIQAKVRDYPLDPITAENQFSEEDVKYLLNGGETSGTGSGSEDVSGSGTDLSGPEISGTDYSSDDNFDADFIKQA